MVVVLFALAVACTGSGATPDSADTGAAALQVGTYGSPDLALTVDANGTAALDRSCWHADLGPLDTPGGALHVSFDWVRTGGDPPDSGGWEHDPAVLDATVTSTAVDGSWTSEWLPEAQPVHLVYGVAGSWVECA